ncbi:FecR family protein [Chitinophaga nivalis]|uniref:FecR domain-containing protein n=1 Tax=Chitinophaga nivalis TaxID=2991709 RepID=A0ABT3INM2_9BACT|nr:FecR domain-containing protein [Chitinophaga nivalis]MCW3464813.1 FecR domain-containing protein [Chitinophaga nivalis]MCW3485496.1 FecR domain-containing protein [Chitinophaga nivalis]
MELHELAPLLQQYRNGTATPEEIRLVEAWLLRTEKTTAYLSPAEKSSTEDRILRKLRAHIGVPPAKRRRLFPPVFIRIAAMFILIAGAGYSLHQYRYHLLDYFDPIPQLTISSGPYNLQQVVLSDSTRVTLAPNSRLTYPARYRGPLREITFTGKGYFSVAKNPAQPFVVHTGNLQVQVLGTSFVVSNQPQDNIVAVSVLTGKVQVRHQQQSLGILTAHKALRFNKTSGQSLLSEMEPAPQMDWINKRLVFNTTPLPEVWKTLESQYHITIQVPISVVKEKVFTGEFTAKDSFTAILDIITISTGLQYQSLNDSTIKIY